MELTESLRKEFIASHQRLAASINNVIDNEYYDYQHVYEIYKTYIEYCKAFHSVDDFSDIPLNTGIKFPKRIIKYNWAGKMTADEFFSYHKYAERDYWFEEKIKEMFDVMKPSLQLIYLYIKSQDFNSDEKLKTELIEIINNQPEKYKRKNRKENIGVFTVRIIFLIVILSVVVFRVIWRK